MNADEKFCLKWNDFQENIKTSFGDLRGEKDFADVTLACEDGEVVGHKVILASCSPFFKRLLKRTKNHQHPLIFIVSASKPKTKETQCRTQADFISCYFRGVQCTQPFNGKGGFEYHHR